MGMIHLYNQRFYTGSDSTVGLLHIPSVFDTPPAFILEDETRGEKVYGETAIPEGTYPLELRKSGGLHQEYRERFAEASFEHRGMLWLRDVPNFTYVEFHVGNSDEDTAGCPLVGSAFDLGNPDWVSGSERAYQKIYPPIARHLDSGGHALLHVRGPQYR